MSSGKAIPAVSQLEQRPRRRDEVAKLEMISDPTLVKSTARFSRSEADLFASWERPWHLLRSV